MEKQNRFAGTLFGDKNTVKGDIGVAVFLSSGRALYFGTKATWRYELIANRYFFVVVEDGITRAQINPDRIETICSDCGVHEPYLR